MEILKFYIRVLGAVDTVVLSGMFSGMVSRHKDVHCPLNSAIHEMTFLHRCKISICNAHIGSWNLAAEDEKEEHYKHNESNTPMTHVTHYSV